MLQPPLCLNLVARSWVDMRERRAVRLGTDTAVSQARGLLTVNRGYVICDFGRRYDSSQDRCILGTSQRAGSKMPHILGK